MSIFQLRQTPTNQTSPPLTQSFSGCPLLGQMRSWGTIRLLTPGESMYLSHTIVSLNIKSWIIVIQTAVSPCPAVDPLLVQCEYLVRSLLTSNYTSRWKLTNDQETELELGGRGRRSLLISLSEDNERWERYISPSTPQYIGLVSLFAPQFIISPSSGQLRAGACKECLCLLVRYYPL